jgi:hypothetical protein
MDVQLYCVYPTAPRCRYERINIRMFDVYAKLINQEYNGLDQQVEQ